MIVAVTGAEGFIGSRLLSVLSAAGHSVRPLGRIRKGELSNRLVAARIDVATGEGLEGALQGTDAVVHLAARNIGRIGFSPDGPGEYRRVNVEGTRNVARAAKTAGVRLFIHASSLKAMGEGSESILDEDSPCQPRTPYGISKLESERVLREEAAGSAMGAIIIRLPLVYGPGGRGNFIRMLRWAERGRPFPIVKPEGVRSVLYSGNFAGAVVALLGASTWPFSLYLLKDKEDASIRTLYSLICRSLGKTPRFIDIPSLGVRLGGILWEDLRRVTGSFRVSSAKFEKQFGYSPPFSLEQGIAETVAWYKRSGR